MFSYSSGLVNFPLYLITYSKTSLLHGYSGNYATWAKSFKELKKQVDQYDFIVIGVDGNYSSWYFDSPIDPTFKYETYIIVIYF